MVVSFIPIAVGASYQDAPQLEPFALTQQVISELTQIDVKGKKGSSFSTKGITIKALKADYSLVKFSIDVDPRLNLWRGRANDIVSSHLGRMDLLVTSIIDENGNNIHDKTNDKPWSNEITIYHRGNGVFNGLRTAKFKQASDNENLSQVSGKIQLSLPVNLKKYVIDANDPKSAEALLERPEISNVELKNGIFIQHPGSLPDFKIIIMGFDNEGKRISITSAGSAGSKSENHWYYFSTDNTFDKMILFIPEKFVEHEIAFTIDMKNE